ncbi:MAG TPA: hydroxymethylglutaryl-CoA synthase family protein [Candidatus Poseidoniales archaeon]|nr:hydroxymethylglutaryl-CoA synthase family protein [Candidatus Poseidoniales archaeon]
MSNVAEVGIDDIAIHFPKLYFDMKDFAEMRGADFGKLNKGLGLTAMSIPDKHEDTATMGANAVTRLLDRNGIDPSNIGRMYLGTESALDGSKPTATYILDMLEQRYSKQYGKDCFRNCDVVDMTFACIGAVDALHNTLDWVARGGEEENRLGIVVFSDNAKYDLESSGEYTQGAGGGALIVRHNPRLISIPDRWGVSTTPVHDFFKPRREVSIKSVITHVLQLAKETGHNVKEGLADRMVKHLPESTVRRLGIFAHGEEMVSVHRDEPIFDGAFSNRCYQEAVKTAFLDFQRRAKKQGRYDPKKDEILTEQWVRIIMHLPYAFQGKRMFPDVFRHDRREKPIWDELIAEIGTEPRYVDFEDTPEGEIEYDKAQDAFRRAISKTAAYQEFHAASIEKGQRASSLIGNQYTGSIFLAMMSTFESDYEDNSLLEGKYFGMCGYGSGAKAKVFEGLVSAKWREVVASWNLFERLAGRQAIDKITYESLHKGILSESVLEPSGEFALVEIESEGVREGARTYSWMG